MVLSLDDSVGGAALARDVAVPLSAVFRLAEVVYSQIDDLAFFVLHDCGVGGLYYIDKSKILGELLGGVMWVFS